MDDIGSILKIIGVFALLIYVIRRMAMMKRRRVDLSESIQRATTIRYSDMRAHALAATPQRLGLEIPDHLLVVYGVVIDWTIGNSVATIVAFANGDAGLYLNIPGGIIGGEMPESVKQAAKNLVISAGGHQAATVNRFDAPVAISDEVRFFLITNRGVRVGFEPVTNIESRSSEWSPVFDDANLLLAEIRASRKRKKTSPAEEATTKGSRGKHTKD